MMYTNPSSVGAGVVLGVEVVRKVAVTFSVMLLQPTVESGSKVGDDIPITIPPIIIHKLKPSDTTNPAMAP